MVEKFRARLLEVKVTHEPPRWGWEVLAGDEVDRHGKMSQFEVRDYRGVWHDRQFSAASSFQIGGGN